MAAAAVAMGEEEAGEASARWASWLWIWPAGWWPSLEA